VIAAHDGPEPQARLAADFDVSDHRNVGRDIGVIGDFGHDTLVGQNDPAHQKSFKMSFERETNVRSWRRKSALDIDFAAESPYLALVYINDDRPTAMRRGTIFPI
jgi:hypothetical protein